VVALTATERAQVCAFVLAVGAGERLGCSVASDVPVDTQWTVIGGEEIVIGTFRLSRLSVREFDGGG